MVVVDVRQRVGGDGAPLDLAEDLLRMDRQPRVDQHIADHVRVDALARDERDLPDVVGDPGFMAARPDKRGARVIECRA